jgi:hypothetical protein
MSTDSHIPETVWHFSNTATLRYPSLGSAYAAVKPLGPAPTMPILVPTWPTWMQLAEFIVYRFS